jgi:hypothetical protein
MKLLATLFLAIGLTGCASQCRHSCILGWGPGSPSFDAVALQADRADACQGDHRTSTPERRAQLGRPDNYERPDFCGAGRGYRKPVNVYNNSGQRIAVIK